jgi:hypothetical protein
MESIRDARVSTVQGWQPRFSRDRSRTADVSEDGTLNLRELNASHGGPELFDIEHAKQVALELVFSCKLTPEKLREIFPATPHNGLANRQTLERKYHSMNEPLKCAACGQVLPR